MLTYGDILIVPPKVSHGIFVHDFDIPYRRFDLWVSVPFFNRLLARNKDYGYATDMAFNEDRHVIHTDRITFNSVLSKLFYIIEEEKGNRLVKETYPLLKELSNINFIGSMEARDVTRGYADVAVCEAFTGNMVLKSAEGTASTLLHLLKDALLSNTRSKIGALLVKPALKSIMKNFDATRYGGAPMLGLKGLVVKVHGNAKASEVCNAVLQCQTFSEKNINQYISEEIINGTGKA